MGKEATARAKRHWSPAEVEKLQSMAKAGLSGREMVPHLPGRTQSAIANKAAAEEIGLNSDLVSPIRTFGEKGGVFIREDHGGVVGIRWGCAHRSGGAFDPQLCEGLADFGLLVPYPSRGQDNLFRWNKADKSA